MLLLSPVPDPSPHQPNPIVEIVLTVALPSMALDYLSETERLGPVWALVVSMLFPLGFGVWSWLKHSSWNALSALGLITVLLSGGLGLLKLDAFWFAVKESAMPVFLGMAFPLSHRWGKPLINSMIMQPQLVNVRSLNAALEEPEKRARFNTALLGASWHLGLGMVASAVANFFLAMWILGGKEPGTPAFVKGVGTLNWSSTVLIGAMLMGIMMLVMIRFLRQVEGITGLDRDDLLNPGRTVRRTVTRE